MGRRVGDFIESVGFIIIAFVVIAGLVQRCS